MAPPQQAAAPASQQQGANPAYELNLSPDTARKIVEMLADKQRAGAIHPDTNVRRAPQHRQAQDQPAVVAPEQNSQMSSQQQQQLAQPQQPAPAPQAYAQQRPGPGEPAYNSYNDLAGWAGAEQEQQQAPQRQMAPTGYAQDDDSWFGSDETTTTTPSPETIALQRALANTAETQSPAVAANPAAAASTNPPPANTYGVNPAAYPADPETGMPGNFNGSNYTYFNNVGQFVDVSVLQSELYILENLFKNSQTEKGEMLRLLEDATGKIDNERSQVAALTAALGAATEV